MEPHLRTETLARIQLLETQLNGLVRAEHSADAKLSAATVSRKTLALDLDSLKIVKICIGALQTNYKSLFRRVDNVAEIAKQLSTNIKDLEEQRRRAKELLDCVSLTQHLQLSIQGAYDAMEAQSWEEAAQLVRSALDTPPSILHGKFAAAIVPSSNVPEPPSAFLQNASEELYSLFRREFDKATRTKDETQVTRFFKLFPMIGRQNEGLDLYAKFICNIIAGRSRAALSTAPDSPIFFSKIFTNLIELMAKLIESHSSIVIRHYGQGQIMRVCEKIQLEGDRQGGIIIDSLMDARQVARKLDESRNYPFNFLVQSMLPASSTNSGQIMRTQSPHLYQKTEDEVQTRDIDILLTEMGSVLARWRLYVRFDTDDDESSVVQIPPFVKNSKFAQKLNTQFFSAYATLEVYFFRRSVELAFQMDEIDTVNCPPTSSVVDDVMFVLKQVLDRVVALGDIAYLRHLCGGLRRILDGEFIGMFKRQLHSGLGKLPIVNGKSVLSMFTQLQLVDQTSDLRSPERLRYLADLNNIGQASDYVNSMMSTVLDSAIFHDLYSIENCIQEATVAINSLRNVREHFIEVLDEGLRMINAVAIKPLIGPLLNEAFKDAAYVLDNISYESARLEGLVETRFSRGWSNIVEPYRANLSESNYQKLLKITLSQLSRLIEKKMLGAIQFEKDLHQIIAHATRFAPYTIRDRFNRVQQLCVAINFDFEDYNLSKEEFVDRMWNDKTIEWELSKDDLARAVEMRRFNQ